MTDDNDAFIPPRADAALPPKPAPAPPPPRTLAQPVDVPSAVSTLPSPPASNVRVIALVLILAFLVGGTSGVLGALAVDRFSNDPVTLPAASTVTSAERPSGSIAAVSQTALPSVVSIETTIGGVVVSTGSGFVIHQDGYIVTNHHVIDNADSTVRVLFSDGTVEQGSIVGSTPEYDIAVLEVDRQGLTPLVFADSDAVVVGDPVIAVGSPLGLEATVTSGIVSALHRPVSAGANDAPAFIDAIQTDAAINPGNSGGPLLNDRGEVIGINSAVAALPIDTGTATFPVVGVYLDNFYQGQGVRVSEDDEELGLEGVATGGPADAAGIKAGDVIVSINGRPVDRAEEIIVAIRAKAPGDTVTLGILIGDDVLDVEVTLVSNEDVDWQEIPEE